MKKTTLLALILLVLPFVGRALAQDPGCDCPTCLTALAAAEEEAKAEQQVAKTTITRETKEAQLLGTWSQLTESLERLGQLRSEISLLEGEVARLSTQLEGQVNAPATGSKVLKPVMGTAPVVPQCGSSCAETLRAGFEGAASEQNAVRATAPVMPQCGSSCAETLRQSFGETAAQVKKTADEPCSAGSCGGCDADAKVQVKKVADEGCGSSCGGCDAEAKVQVKKVVDEACSDCGSCGGCDAAAKVQVKKVADEGCSDCGSCGTCDGATKAQMVKAYDAHGRVQDCCPKSAVAGMCDTSLDRALAMANVRLVRTEANVARAEVRLRSLKTEVAMVKLGQSFAPAAQQVKALSSDCGSCGDCGTCPVTGTQVKATKDAGCDAGCGSCGGCDAAATQVKAVTEGCSDCGSCGGCDAAEKVQVKKVEAKGDCGSCGGCDAKAEAVQVKKVETEKAGSCGGCGAKADA